MPLSEMGRMAMLHLNYRGFSLIKSIFDINLYQITINSIVFSLNGASTTIASGFAVSEEKSNFQ